MRCPRPSVDAVGPIAAMLIEPERWQEVRRAYAEIVQEGSASGDPRDLLLAAEDGTTAIATVWRVARGPRRSPVGA